MSKAIADPVTHAELQAELRRLRAAVMLLAECLGAHVIDRRSGSRLVALLAPPGERERLAQPHEGEP